MGNFDHDKSQFWSETGIEGRQLLASFFSLFSHITEAKPLLFSFSLSSFSLHLLHLSSVFYTQRHIHMQRPLWNSATALQPHSVLGFPIAFILIGHQTFCLIDTSCNWWRACCSSFVTCCAWLPQFCHSQTPANSAKACTALLLHIQADL